jgi:hypothetical protein
VVLAVTDGAVDIVLAVFAQLPVADDVRSCLFMALDALLAEKRLNQEGAQENDQTDEMDSLLHLNLHLLFYAVFSIWCGILYHKKTDDTILVSREYMGTYSK